jgi:hypothetical protein
MGIFLNTTGDMRISNVATAMSSVKNTMVSNIFTSFLREALDSSPEPSGRAGEGHAVPARDRSEPHIQKESQSR